MPVILDRLPLPNISWYTGISVFCLLCSVYYAGVQVKMHPDWKEQLELRKMEQSQQHQLVERGLKEQQLRVLISELFAAEDYTIARGATSSVKLYYILQRFKDELEKTCSRETLNDIISSILLHEMCYLRYNSQDLSFAIYKHVNDMRIKEKKELYLPYDYTKICQKNVAKFSVHYYNLKKLHFGATSSQSDILDAKGGHASNSDGSTKGNQCSSDTFYDSYKRDIDRDVSLYHIPPAECDDLEREMSPYLIPEIISFMFHEPLCIWVRQIHNY